ncbi:hypothetical protein [Comamonas sp. CMM02]|uniref:hypothetical protein n=1 Tax=Comamonas sp. CMM02 TaxID=2769307 RepID=UPI001780522A|nr:hypothetical protein [Comamonas sp. CMM02]MBD9402362.1 hypothetical protein [Comamonas sp. CMM02]
MALQIKRMDVHCTREVHERLNAMYDHTECLGLRFEHLAWKFGLKGKAKKN